jgi:small subunit ribosomal protein S6
MKDYELVMVLTPELEEKGVETFIEKVGRWISDRGGSITKVEKWGRRKLAYPIKHLWEGNYILAQFRVDPLKVKELRDNLKLSQEVIRYLVVKMEE